MDFATSFADLFIVLMAFLDKELSLLLFFPSNKVVVFVLDGVAKPFTRVISLATTLEGNRCISLDSSLLTMAFSNLEESLVMDIDGGVNSNNDLSFDGQIPFMCPLRVPLFRF